jgi:hypothetical protein
MNLDIPFFVSERSMTDCVLYLTLFLTFAFFKIAWVTLSERHGQVGRLVEQAGCARKHGMDP